MRMLNFWQDLVVHVKRSDCPLDTSYFTSFMLGKVSVY